MSDAAIVNTNYMQTVGFLNRASGPPIVAEISEARCEFIDSVRLRGKEAAIFLGVSFFTFILPAFRGPPIFPLVTVYEALVWGTSILPLLIGLISSIRLLHLACFKSAFVLDCNKRKLAAFEDMRKSRIVSDYCSKVAQQNRPLLRAEVREMARKLDMGWLA